MDRTVLTGSSSPTPVLTVHGINKKSGSLGLKNRFSSRFPVFTVRPPGPVRFWKQWWWWAWPVVIYRQKEKEKYNYRNRKKYPNRFIDFFFLFFLEGGWSTKKNCFENKFINYYIILFWEKNKNKTGGRTGLQLLKIIEKLQPMGMQRSLSRVK